MPIYKKVLPLPVMAEIENFAKTETKGQLYYSSKIWARILFDFAMAYRNGEVNRQDLLEALIPFYHSRVLSYVNKTQNSQTREAEEYLENINRVFEKEKYYLLQRWNESRNGRILFK
jgi:hypothetical protein